MKKVVVSQERKTQEYMANPHINTNLDIRLKKSGCIRYGKSKKITDLGNGYMKISAK